jgi:hypothetical protein
MILWNLPLSAIQTTGRQQHGQSRHLRRPVCSLAEAVRALRANDNSPAQIRAMLDFILDNAALIADVPTKAAELRKSCLR